MESSFAKRLKEAMETNGITGAELSKATGISRPLISKYIHGVTEAKQSSLYKLAVALNVSEPWLMGLQAPKERKAQAQFLEVQSVPLLGEIACGTPIFANEDFEAYVAVGARINCDFCLRAKGDSMIGARIQDGDLVFIRKQPMVENGEIAAVIIGEETTLKRVFLSEGKLVLQAENPKYAPMVYVGEELNEIKILGKAIAFHSDLR